MKQILKYPGAKWRISEWIISHFPQHKVYCEPFFGSGAVFFNKPRTYLETINDIDGNIVNLFKVCRDHPDELARLIEFTPFARDEFKNCYDKSDDPIEQARRTLVRFHQSFGTSNSSKNRWRNVQTYGGPRCATMWNNLPEIICTCCQRLKDAQIENIDAIELIERYDDVNTLIYCDPPYLRGIRKRNIYSYETSDAYHIRLLKTICKSKSMIVISGYDNTLYNDMLAEWNTDEKQTTAQMGLPRIEKLWMNFNYNISFID
nr:MAG TPA: DNA adenine methylase [Bacteriophage sp.]